MHLNFYYEKSGIPGQKTWSIDIRTFHSLSPPRWRHTLLFLNLWHIQTNISPFDLFSFAGFVNLLLFSCLFASSATTTPDLPVAADGAPDVPACAAADFFFFPPILSPKHPLLLYSQCNDEKSIHSVSSDQWYLNLDIWKSYYENRITEYSPHLACCTIILSHPATVPEVLPGTASWCIVGSVPLTVMADAFGDNLFSVFDDDDQTSTSKNVPASLTTDIG